MFSMAPATTVVKETLGRPIQLMKELVGSEVETARAASNKIMSDPEKFKEFRASLTKIAEVYCSVAFGTPH